MAKTPVPDKPSEDTITEGVILDEITHSTKDFAAPEPSPSQGRSIKDTLVFGPDDWDVCLLNPFHIHPGSQIRPVRLTGKKGFTLIRESIMQKRFDTTSLIIVWRDEQHDPAAQPPRFLCVDGMHRVQVVQALMTEKYANWPPGMVDSATGEIRLQCAVLRETPTRKEVIQCALARNALTSSVVETTYIDTLASIQAAREVVPAMLIIGRDPRDVGLRKALLEILKFGVSPKSSVSTIRKDILVHTDLLEKGLYNSVMELASTYGHEWFSRHAFNAVMQRNGAAFVFSTFKLWLGKQTDSDLGKLTDLRKAKLFREFCPVVGGYYDSFSSLCKQLHTIRKKHDTCCLGHVDTLQAVREAVVTSVSPTAQPTHDDSVITKITAIVEARAISAMPPVPRLEGVEIESVPPSTPAPPPLRRQRDVPSKKTRDVPAPIGPRTPPPPRIGPSPPPTPRRPIRSAPDPLLETSDVGCGPSTGPRPMGPTMALRSRDANKRNAPDDSAVEDARQQPQKRAKRTQGTPTAGGDDGAASDRSSGSSAESLFDDDASKGIEEVTYPSVPPASAIYRVFSKAEASNWFNTPPLQGSAADNAFFSLFHAINLSKAGYTVIPDVIREDTFLSHTEVDELFDFCRKAFSTPGGKCCASALEPAFGTIFNAPEGVEEPADTPGRHQSNRHSFHQHLEGHHEALFKIKLKLDVSVAIIGQFLKIRNCRLPKSGGRLLLSEPGCTAQPPHCDYKVRFSSTGTPVSDGSYFMMHSGRDGAKVLVWPASHNTVTKLDWMKRNQTELNDSSLQTMSRRDIERLGTDFFQQQKPMEVVIPPYSMYVARGDVVHAGAAHNGPEPNVRCHVHLTSVKDKTLNNVVMRPFGI
ncbi:MAG: hypothetical protein ORO03_04725 [Alphaproteobacteria bacterium]|nr:hypothetical protein [Alphaproteobacteria bacterium]